MKKAEEIMNKLSVLNTELSKIKFESGLVSITPLNSNGQLFYSINLGGYSVTVNPQQLKDLQALLKKVK